MTATKGAYAVLYWEGCGNEGPHGGTVTLLGLGTSDTDHRFGDLRQNVKNAVPFIESEVDPATSSGDVQLIGDALTVARRSKSGRQGLQRRA